MSILSNQSGKVLHHGIYLSSPEASMPHVSLFMYDFTNETQKISMVSLASSFYFKPVPAGLYALGSCWINQMFR